jgi:hypothetical protein
MATSLTLQNDASLAQGYIQVNGTTSATFTTTGITGNLTGNVTGNVTGSLTSGGAITLATAQTASGTAVDFTGIPSWAKRITVMFNGVSTNGGSGILIQIGSGSITNSGYSSSATYATTAVGSSTSTAGFLINASGSVNSGSVNNGNVILCLQNNNAWTSFGVLSLVTATATQFNSGVSPALGSALDRVRITNVNGTDAFDAGTINISYEG